MNRVAVSLLTELDQFWVAGAINISLLTEQHAFHVLEQVYKH